MSSVWTRTWPKSQPNLGSMNARVAGSSGRPGVPMPWCTTRGAVPKATGPVALRCNLLISSSWQRFTLRAAGVLAGGARPLAAV